MADAEKVKITYEGPDDKSDISDYIEVYPTPKSDPVRIPKGIEIEVDKAVAVAAGKISGHKFTTAKTGSGQGNA